MQEPGACSFEKIQSALFTKNHTCSRLGLTSQEACGVMGGLKYSVASLCFHSQSLLETVLEYTDITVLGIQDNEEKESKGVADSSNN